MTEMTALTMTAAEIAKENRQLQARLRRMLKEAGHEGVEIQYIRRARAWGDRIRCAVVFDADCDTPLLLVVEHGDWLWVM